MRLVISVFIASLMCSVISAKETRLTKKEKNELVELCSNYSRLERSMRDLHDIVNTIQNSLVNINVGDQNQAIKQLNDIQDQLKRIYELLLIEKQVLGHLDDESVSSDFFNNPDDIDTAELSLISWLKSIYRRQLEDDHLIS